MKPILLSAALAVVAAGVATAALTQVPSAEDQAQIARDNQAASGAVGVGRSTGPAVSAPINPSQTEAPFNAAPASAPPASAAPESAGPVEAGPFEPGLADMMSMMVQPRHIRLYYAGQAQNWELAAAQNRSLRQAFIRIALSIPRYQGADVLTSRDTFLGPSLDELDAAIAAADPKRFSVAYQGLTQGCNACHTYMEHPFLVIKTPSAPAAVVYPDEDFKPAP